MSPVVNEKRRTQHILTARDLDFLSNMRVRDVNHIASDLWAQIDSYVSNTYCYYSKEYRLTMLNELHRIKWHEWQALYNF